MFTLQTLYKSVPSNHHNLCYELLVKHLSTMFCNNLITKIGSYNWKIRRNRLCSVITIFHTYNNTKRRFWVWPEKISRQLKMFAKEFTSKSWKLAELCVFSEIWTILYCRIPYFLLFLINDLLWKHWRMNH